MDAIDLLLTRASNGKLQEPAPDEATLERVLQAAARAPDHGAMRPLRVFSVRGEAREALGQLMAESLRRKQPTASADELDKMKKKALRAPLVLVVCAVLRDNPKVPHVEQVLCAGAAAHAMLLALHARGFAGIWRTGDVAYDDATKRAFGLEPRDAIVGFLYVGTPKQDAPAQSRPAPAEFASEWTGPLR